MLYLYGNPDLHRDEPAKVRIVYSRERSDTNNDGAEGKWICQVVRLSLSCSFTRSDFAQCSVNNYATRVRCFRCQAFRAGM